MKTLALIGFMGVGKSTVGEILADKTKQLYVDLDEEIEKNAGMTIADIFQKHGEAWFRALETKVLEQFIGEKVIVGTGGGIIMNEKNRTLLKRHFNPIWLKTAFHIIDERLKGDQTRPLWNQRVAERKRLFDERLSLYEETAEFIIETDKRSPNEVADRILNVTQLYEK